MTNDSAESWRSHFAIAGGPHVHIVDATCQPDDVSHGAEVLGFARIRVDVSRVCNRDELLDAMASAGGFPSYFGRNWDALSDLLRDLSWLPAKGYALLVVGAERLLDLPKRDFATFVGILETAIRDWRDERGEYAERTAPIPFHVVLWGGKAVRDRVALLLTERWCEHAC